MGEDFNSRATKGAPAVSPLRSIVPRLLRASSTTASLCTARRPLNPHRAQRESNRGSRAPTARGGRACRPPRPHAWGPDHRKRALLAKSSYNRWQADTRSPICIGVGTDKHGLLHTSSVYPRLHSTTTICYCQGFLLKNLEKALLNSRSPITRGLRPYKILILYNHRVMLFSPPRKGENLVVISTKQVILYNWIYISLLPSHLYHTPPKIFFQGFLRNSARCATAHYYARSRARSKKCNV